MRGVNSGNKQRADYGRGEYQIDAADFMLTLEDAISQLGLRTSSDLFLQTVLSMRVFRADGYDGPMATLMKHSMLTAHIARLACRMTAPPDEYAFMCGLLHDAGMAAGLLIFADAQSPHSSRESTRSKPPPPPSYDEVAIALCAVHEEASAILAEAWKLNPDIRVVLSSHHHLRGSGGRIHPLAAVVCVSDWIASEAGAGMGAESDFNQAELAANELRFTQANLATLSAKAREILELSA